MSRDRFCHLGLPHAINLVASGDCKLLLSRWRRTSVVAARAFPSA